MTCKSSSPALTSQHGIRADEQSDEIIKWFRLSMFNGIRNRNECLKPTKDLINQVWIDHLHWIQCPSPPPLRTLFTRCLMEMWCLQWQLLSIFFHSLKIESGILINPNRHWMRLDSLTYTFDAIRCISETHYVKREYNGRIATTVFGRFFSHSSNRLQLRIIHRHLSAIKGGNKNAAEKKRK